MKTLFIDSSRKSLSIALFSHGELLFVSNVNSYSKHSNYLMNEINNILSKCNLKISDIDNFLVLNGPGSFTGVRVGLTISKTLAWALNKKLYVESNLKALTYGIKNDIVISVIYDKKSDSYVGIYSENDSFESYINIEDEKFNIKNKNITVVSLEDNEYLIKLIAKLKENNTVEKIILSDYDYDHLISEVLKKDDVNVHLAKPLYLKKIDAEK